MDYVHQCTCQIKQNKIKMCIFQKIFNFNPIVPQNISLHVSFSRPNSYASYAEWVNECQSQENWTIQNFEIITITNFFLLLYTYIDIAIFE